MHSDGDVSCSCNRPSGHSSPRPIPHCNVPPTKVTSEDYKMDYHWMPNFKDFEGPYKDYKPPGSRTPTVGQKDWGDVPYLPSYLDPMYFPPKALGQSDNLYTRGPFYRGVSETHTEFVNRGLPLPREYHAYTRHYEEPGMKDSRSVTQVDFTSPYPMLPGDKTPCLKEDPPEPWYEPEKKPLKNPHAKEVEARPQLTGLVYVDEEVKRDFTTEHVDNYVCYQKSKTGCKIQDPAVKRGEIFLENMRQAHQECAHPPMSEDACEGLCRTLRPCPGPTLRTESWLLHPRNYQFKNGTMLIPCWCRKSCKSLDGICTVGSCKCLDGICTGGSCEVTRGTDRGCCFQRSKLFLAK